MKTASSICERRVVKVTGLAPAAPLSKRGYSTINRRYVFAALPALPDRMRLWDDARTRAGCGVAHPPAFDSGKPGSPASASPAVTIGMHSPWKVRRRRDTSSGACLSVAGPLPLHGGSTAREDSGRLAGLETNDQGVIRFERVPTSAATAAKISEAETPQATSVAT